MFGLATSRKGKTLAAICDQTCVCVCGIFGSLKINGIHGYSLAPVQVRVGLTCVCGSMRGEGHHCGAIKFFH